MCLGAWTWRVFFRAEQFMGARKMRKDLRIKNGALSAVVIG
jgi:hypothetical protein